MGVQGPLHQDNSNRMQQLQGKTDIFITDCETDLVKEIIYYRYLDTRFCYA